MSDWISVKDEWPERDESVLVAGAFGEPKIDKININQSEDRFTWGSGGVTHWMPLPELPKKEIE